MAQRRVYVLDIVYKSLGPGLRGDLVIDGNYLVSRRPQTTSCNPTTI